MVERDLEETVSFLVGSLGFRKIGEEGSWQRYAVSQTEDRASASPGIAVASPSGQYIDLRSMPDSSRGAWGTGSVHHLAWRVDDGAHQLEVRERVLHGGAHPTPVIDRFWFKSVYFREPGGVLFELATDGPGFHVDEEMASLGESLVLPPWLEAEPGCDRKGPARFENAQTKLPDMITQTDRLDSIRAARPAEGLFAEKDWLISPEPFPIEARLRADLERLGHQLFVFQRACNQLYQQSAKGKQPEWVARYLDIGKPAALVEYSRRKEFRDVLPRVIRPDLILDDEGWTIAETDSVPGGIGLTGWLNQTYAGLGSDVIGGADGMLDGFATVLPQRRRHSRLAGIRHLSAGDGMARQAVERALSQGSASFQLAGRNEPAGSSLYPPMACPPGGKLSAPSRARCLPVFRVI